MKLISGILDEGYETEVVINTALSHILVNIIRIGVNFVFPLTGGNFINPSAFKDGMYQEEISRFANLSSYTVDNSTMPGEAELMKFLSVYIRRPVHLEFYFTKKFMFVHTENGRRAQFFNIGAEKLLEPYKEVYFHDFEVIFRVCTRAGGSSLSTSLDSYKTKLPLPSYVLLEDVLRTDFKMTENQKGEFKNHLESLTYQTYINDEDSKKIKEELTNYLGGAEFQDIIRNTVQEYYFEGFKVNRDKIMLMTKS